MKAADSSSVRSLMSSTWRLEATMHRPRWLCSLKRISWLAGSSQMGMPKAPTISSFSAIMQ